MIGLQLLFTYAPVMNRLFATEPIDGECWWHITAVGLLAYLVVGLEKLIRFRFGKEEQDARRILKDRSSPGL